MAKFLEVETEYGKIEISDSVIAEVVTDAADQFEGRMYLSKSGGKVIQHGSGAEGSAVSVEFDGDEIDIEVYVILKFGLSIKRITGRFIDEIESGVALLVGKPPRNISIIVKGILSRRLAKRDIVIRKGESDEPDR